MAGDAGNDVVVEEGGVAAGKDAATAATAAAAGLVRAVAALWRWEETAVEGG